MNSVTNNLYCARFFGKCCEVRGIIAEPSLAEHGIKPQDFNYFILLPHSASCCICLWYFHPWLFLNENQWVKNYKVILYSDNFFSPFYIVHIIEPSEWADVVDSLHCSGPFPSLSSHSFLSLCMVIFLFVPFLSFIPGKCTYKTQKCITITNGCPPKALMTLQECPSLETSLRPLLCLTNLTQSGQGSACHIRNHLCANSMKSHHLHSCL